MKRIAMIATLGVALMGFVRCADADDSETLSKNLETFLATTQVPGGAIAVFGPKSAIVATAGVRRIGGTDALQRTDAMHLGSNIKAMTAWLLAYNIDHGRLQWTTTLLEIFPELAASMRPEYRAVTVSDVLRHRSGILPLPDLDALAALPTLPAEPAAARQAFVTYALTQAQTFDPGVHYGYSNGGYAVAGAIVDRLQGVPYEGALSTLLFAPLHIHALHAWPASGGAAGPWGHRWDVDHWVEVDPDSPDYQLPPVLNAAGHVSMPIDDYVRYVQLHLSGLRGGCALLSSSAYQALHTPDPDSGYSSGWLEFEAGGDHFTVHDGSAGTFYARTLLQPSRGIGVVILLNAANEGSPAFEDPLTGLTLQALSLNPPDIFAGDFESCR